jgi:hypothetical protein
MSNAMAQRNSQDEAISSGASDIALRQALDEVRQLAAQSGLLALNAAFESAGASDEMDGPGGSAGPAAAEAARIVAAVELLLQQIQSASAASAVSGPL